MLSVEEAGVLEEGLVRLRWDAGQVFLQHDDVPVTLSDALDGAVLVVILERHAAGRLALAVEGAGWILGRDQVADQPVHAPEPLGVTVADEEDVIRQGRGGRRVRPDRPDGVAVGFGHGRRVCRTDVPGCGGLVPRFSPGPMHPRGSLPCALRSQRGARGERCDDDDGEAGEDDSHGRLLCHGTGEIPSPECAPETPYLR